jgi:sensor histidine kinase YesM
MKITGKALGTAIQISIWILFFGVGFLFYSVFFSWGKSVLYSLIQNVLSAFLFYGNFFFIDFFFEKKQFRGYVLTFTGIAVIAVFLRTMLNDLFFPSSVEKVIPVFRPEVRIWFFSFFTTIPVLMVSFFYQFIRNRFQAERQYLSLINQHNEARIQFLKAQINPHFLFNTLHNIYSLAVIKSDETPRMILLLSGLLRYVIYESQKGKVGLQIETEHLQKFIDLFQMRNEKPVHITFQIQGNPEHTSIEPMILIPLVENCFKHCDFDTNENAFVKINLYIENKNLTFHTQNSKNEELQQKDKTGGVGLENIRKRLELLYGNQYSFVIRNEKDTFEVTLSLAT